MDANKTSATESQSGSTPRSGWDKLLSTTPVIMTVVATVLAGLSNSEMIKAQYYRSLAAQNQSKVGDQWAFFQAKRARGTNYDMTIKVLRSFGAHAELSPETLRAQVERLQRTLREGCANVEQIANQLKKEQPTLDSQQRAILGMAEQLCSIGQSALARAKRCQASLNAALSDPGVVHALAALDGGPAESTSFARAVDAIADERIRELLQEIGRRKTEQETEALTARVDEAHLQEAIHAVESRAGENEAATRPVAKALDRVEQCVVEANAIAQSWDRAVADFRANTALPAQSAAPPATLAAQSLKNALQEVNASFTCERLRFDEQRYQREADENRIIAGLYEIQVRKSGWHSERHRKRSGYFFYGMLAAQAGVTIASLALAVRMKSLLWGVASAAGAIAVAIGAYVYVYI